MQAAKGIRRVVLSHSRLIRRGMASNVDSTQLLMEVDPKGLVASATINRPKALNALTPDICNAMNGHLEAWAADRKNAPKVMIMRGAGEKAFCAGGDVKAMYEDAIQGGDDVGTGTPGRPSSDFFHDEYIMNYNLGISKVKQVLP